MKLCSLALSTAVLVIGMSGCSSSKPVLEDLSEQDRAALRSIAEKDASIVLARNWDALAAEYSTDAVRMPPNQPPVVGRAAIRRWLDQFPPIQSFSFRLVDLQGHGDMAFIRGAYAITMTPPSVPSAVSDTGKILVVLRKQADGSWLRVADAWNSDLPPGK